MSDVDVEGNIETGKSLGDGVDGCIWFHCDDGTVACGVDEKGVLKDVEIIWTCRVDDGSMECVDIGGHGDRLNLLSTYVDIDMYTGVSGIWSRECVVWIDHRALYRENKLRYKTRVVFQDKVLKCL